MRIGFDFKPAVGLQFCWSIVFLMLMVGSGCGRKQEEKGEAPTRDINQVMSDHTSELMAIPGVTGVAIGKLDDGTPCILVLVEQETPEITQKVPKTLEHHPVKILVSGKIVPMDSN